MSGGFQRLVEQGLSNGLSATAAEQWARDKLYGGLEDDEPDDGLAALNRFAQMDDAPPAASVDGFASVDELWANLQRAWEQRDKGVELVDVLEEVNDLLDRGVISAEQFRDLLVRAEEMRTSSGRTAYKSGMSKVAPGARAVGRAPKSSLSKPARTQVEAAARTRADVEAKAKAKAERLRVESEAADELLAANKALLARGEAELLLRLIGPRGERKGVKASPTMPLSRVLHAFCAEHNLEPDSWPATRPDPWLPAPCCCSLASHHALCTFGRRLHDGQYVDAKQTPRDLGLKDGAAHPAPRTRPGQPRRGRLWPALTRLHARSRRAPAGHCDGARGQGAG